jgi:MATE family multidrug resistance protein
MTSQALGAGQDHEIQPIVGAGIYLALALSAASLAIGVPIVTSLPGLAASAESGALASEYMMLRLLGAPLLLTAAALREARYGVGDTRSPMRAALISNLLHIPLNYALIFTLDLGVSGAAISSVISQAIDLGMLVAAQSEQGFGLRKATPRHARELWKLGVPVGAEFFLGVSAFSVLVVLIARMSEADLAAHQVVLQVVHLAFMPALAIGEAASVLTGQAVGADRDDLVVRIGRRAIGLGAVYMTLCAVSFLLGSELIMKNFSVDPTVQQIGIRLLFVAAGFQLFDAANIVTRGVLRGTGDVRFPAIAAIASAWLFLPPFTYLLGFKLGLGAVGGWLALTLEVLAIGGVLLWRLEKRHWLAAALRSRARLASQADGEMAQATV